MYLNPSMAGTGEKGRLNIIGQKFNIKTDGILSPVFYTSSLSFDKHLADIKGGIGINMLDTRTSNSITSTTSLLLSYSPYISIFSKKCIIKPAIEGGINLSRINNSEYFLKAPFVFDSIPPDKNFHKQYFYEINAGILVYKNNFNVGIALKQINQPRYESAGYNYKIPIKYTLHSGLLIPKKNGLRNSSLYTYLVYKQAKHSFGPVENFLALGIIYNRNDSAQSKFNLWRVIKNHSLYGFYLGYQPYRTLTISEISFQYGLRIKSIQINYSYILTQSGNFFKDFGVFAHSNSYIIHEVSFSFKFLSQKKMHQPVNTLHL
jgi:hypothetical protein